MQRIALLFARYRQRTISAAEFDELLVWLYGLSEEQANELADADKELWEKAKAGQLVSNSDEVNWDKMLEQIMASDNEPASVKPVRRLWPRVAAAAAVILLVGSGLFFLLNNKKETPPVAEVPVQRLPEQVLPNTNQTVLTIAGGKQIYLDSVGNGSITDQVVKLQNGEISYAASTAVEPEYHTITVPRGGRSYQLQLADGSKIWLNAASSLRYPSFFKGESREVELTGEGYFEVAASPSPSEGGVKRPFHVKYNNMDVTVLGTHFNVNTYEDEKDVRVTLLEGSVKVNETLIKPGQQSILSRENQSIRVAPANTDISVAWVKGYFQFDKADVKTILRQVSRWYDLDVEYKGAVSPDLFSGKIERNLPLTGIVKLLSGINMKVEGKKLIVQ